MEQQTTIDSSSSVASNGATAIVAPKPFKKRYLETTNCSFSPIEQQKSTNIGTQDSKQHHNITMQDLASDSQNNDQKKHTSESSISLQEASLSPSASQKSANNINVKQTSSKNLTNNSNNNSNGTASKTQSYTSLPTISSKPIATVATNNRAKRKAVMQDNEDNTSSSPKHNYSIRPETQLPKGFIDPLMLDQDMLGKIIANALSSDSQHSSSSISSTSSPPSTLSSSSRNSIIECKPLVHEFISLPSCNTLRPNPVYMSPQANNGPTTAYDLMSPETRNLVVACPPAPTTSLPPPLVSATGLPMPTSPLITSHHHNHPHHQYHNQCNTMGFMSQHNTMSQIQSSRLQQQQQQQQHQASEQKMSFHVDMVSMAVLHHETSDSGEFKRSNQKIQMRRRSSSTSAINNNTNNNNNNNSNGNSASNPDEPVDFSISKTYAQTSQNIINNVIDKLLAKDSNNSRVMLLA